MKFVSATANGDGIEHSARRFGTPSRLANTKPYSKPSPLSKKAFKAAKGPNYVDNRSAALEREGQENSIHATQANLAFDFSGNAGALLQEEPSYDGHLAVGGLNLPPFKVEPSSVDLLHVPPPNDQGHRAETHQGISENPEDSKDFNYDEAVLSSNTDDPGMPTRADFARITNDYVQGLHERKRDKALITHAMHTDIFESLAHPEATRVGSPQFRFWARKMFQLVEAGGEVKTLVITHGGRPVAVREQIYDILCMAHRESGHAGRDKTCKVLREYYTWIPKELTANFVKACPICIDKRSRDVKRRERLFGTERIELSNAPATTGAFVADRKVKSESRNFMQSLSYSGPNDANQNRNYLDYSSGDVSANNTPVCSQGSFAQYGGPQAPETEVDDKSTVTLLGDTTLGPSNSSYAHDSTVSYELPHVQTPQAHSQPYLSPTASYYTFTPEHELPGQMALTGTPYPSVNSGTMYNYGSPFHRAPMTPLPPLMDHLSKAASPSLEGQAVLPRIKEEKSKPHLYTLATGYPIDPMLLPNGNYNTGSSNGLENIHLHVPRPVVNGSPSNALLSPSGSYYNDPAGYLNCSISNARALAGQALVGPGQPGLEPGTLDGSLAEGQSSNENNEQLDTNA